MADEVKPEVVEASANPEVVESSTTTTTSTTKVTRRVRRTSRSRSPSPSRGRSSRSRSPSRRKALNRSPSPHRYNTRINSQVTAEEQTETTPTSGCSLTSSLSCVSSAIAHIKRKYKSITVDLIKCTLYISLAYTALTICSFGKCDIRYPTVPSLGIIYNEKIFLECLAGFVVCVLAFSVTLGERVTGVPTDRGTLSYLCNSPAALFITLLLNFGVYKYDPSLLDTSGKELQLFFSTLLLILITAVCIQWQFASFGNIYNVAAAILVAFLAETRLGLTGFPPVYFSSVALILAIGLNTYALVKALFGGPSNCASTCASRGLLILSVTWLVSHSHFARPNQECFINTSALFAIQCIIVMLSYLVYLNEERAKASGLMLLIIGVITGVLFQQKYLTIPDKVPFISLWYCLNIGSVLDALIALALGGWKTNFLGFKPFEFVRRVLEGKHDPRYGAPPFFSNLNLDVKFICIRFGHLCPVLFCIIKGAERYNAGTLPCILATVLAMTLAYSFTKLIFLEKAITSSTEIVSKRCSVGFMIWSLCVQPTLTYLPLRYVLSAPADAINSTCCYHMVLMVATFIFGLVLHIFSTLQGHYLLIGEAHWLTKCLTTLAANGGEQIPVSGLWRFIRYPFITGDIMAVASIALFCGCDAPLVYLPLAVLLLQSLHSIRSYNKISPSFYGIRAWNSYQQMVKFNIIPGIY